MIVTCAKENLGPKWYICPNAQEDKILKLLYEQQGQKKWSDVAEIMRAEYGILGRNGKQCRERSINLNSDIIITLTRRFLRQNGVHWKTKHCSSSITSLGIVGHSLHVRLKAGI